MRTRRTLIALIATLSTALLAGQAAAAAPPSGVTLNGVRIGAKDVAALARFYQSAFGMHEVQRIQTPQFLEVMLDFGATADAARANTGADVVIMQRAADDGVDTLAHVVFTVIDMDTVVKAVKAAGGRMERDPFVFGDTGIRIGMGIDPAGNHFELIQFAK
jgi:predicted enzyme related to lactoylglutathione lyase